MNSSISKGNETLSERWHPFNKARNPRRISRQSPDGNSLPVVDVEKESVVIPMSIRDATERLERDYFGVDIKDFCFAGHEWRLLLHFEGGNLVLHLQRKDSDDLKVHEVFYSVGIVKIGERVLHHWQEGKWSFESPEAPAWIGPSKSDLLHNRERLLQYDRLNIFFAMSSSSPSLSRTFDCYRKEPIEKGQISTANTSTAVTEKGFEKREEDCLSLHCRALRTLSQSLKDLYLEDKDHDVQIIIGNKTLDAHRAILKARSPVLWAMFSNDMSEARTGEVRLEDCHADDFAVFLLFLYSGTAEGLTSENVLSVYDIAAKYDVPELVEACTHHVLSNLTVHTVSDVVGLALKHGDDKLLQEATDFFVKHAEEIFPTVEWQRFLTHNPIQANELVIKSYSFKKF